MCHLYGKHDGEASFDSLLTEYWHGNHWQKESGQGLCQPHHKHDEEAFLFPFLINFVQKTEAGFDSAC